MSETFPTNDWAQQPAWTAALEEVAGRITRLMSEVAALQAAVDELVQKARTQPMGSEPVSFETTTTMAERADAVAEPQAETPHQAPVTDDDAEARREEVRRAVEMARHELETGELKSGAAPHPWAPEALAPLPSTEEPERLADRIQETKRAGRPASLPSIIVIEDPDGRVELVRIYDVLNRLGNASQAQLVNYTHHSVTISVGPGAVPSVDALTQAVSSAFGRNCEVSYDETRVTVKVTSSAQRGAA